MVESLIIDKNINKRALPLIFIPIGSIILGASIIYFKYFHPAFGSLLVILGFIILVVNVAIMQYVKRPQIHSI